jgi:hypothetical protein
MNPWRAYLLLLQDFSRWTGACGGMIRSDLHKAESLADGCCDPNQGQRDTRGWHQEERKKFPLRHSGRPRPKGVLPFHHDVGP